MYDRFLHHRWLPPLAVLLLLVTGLLGPGFAGRAAAQATSHHSASIPASVLSPDGDPLLLVHGFDDSCEYAFNQKDLVPNTGLNASTTVNYLTQHGWGLRGHWMISGTILFLFPSIASVGHRPPPLMPPLLHTQPLGSEQPASVDKMC